MEKREADSDKLALKIRVIKAEIRESKREEVKCLNNAAGSFVTFVFSIIGCFYYKQEIETKIWAFFIVILLGLLCLFLGFYWYNRYQKAKRQIEKLEKELARLEKERQN